MGENFVKKKALNKIALYVNIYNNYKDLRFVLCFTPEKYLKKIEISTRKFLNKLPQDKALNYIQMARYYSDSEKLAYNESDFAMRKFGLESLEDYKMLIHHKCFFFKEKSMILKKIGFEKIKEIREAHKDLLKIL